MTYLLAPHVQLRKSPRPRILLTINPLVRLAEAKSNKDSSNARLLLQFLQSVEVSVSISMGWPGCVLDATQTASRTRSRGPAAKPRA